MPHVAQLALWGALPLIVVLFALLPPARAAIVSLLGGWAFLPTAYFPSPHDAFINLVGVSLPTQLFITKASVIGLGVLLGVLLFDRVNLRRLRWRWFDVPLWVWCAMPVVAALRNDVNLATGLASSAYLALAWGGPYLMGRLYLADAGGMRDWGAGLVIVGLIYIPLCLVEMIFRPHWYRLIYGFMPYQNIGVERYVGYRPLVFLEDGNELGIFLAITAVTALWLWRSGALRRLGRLPMSIAAGALVAVTVMAQSVGSVILMLAAAAVLLARRWFAPKLLLGAMIALVVLYVGVRASHVLPAREVAEHTWIGREAKAMLYDVGRKSLGWRLKQEDRHLPAVWQRPIVGWGQWDWWKTISGDRPWGLWLLVLGSYGIVGLAAMGTLVLLPVARLLWTCPAKAWAHPQWAAAIAAAAVLIIASADALLNSGFIVVLVAACGGINGAVQS